ncbi:MAG: proline dipeptidase [Thermoplasmata archaeon HGW-Thermoplasmata-1]|nr:MAG: proline dipeptidase [Thermoplasmata archaeon HGW-Thermoplasmata-1]
MAKTNGRVKKIYSKIDALSEKEGLKRPDVVIFKNAVEPHLDLSFFYVSGIECGMFEGGATVLHPDGTLDVVSSILEEESAKSGPGNYDLHVFSGGDESGELVGRLAGTPKTVGVNAQELTYKDFLWLRGICPKAEFVDVGRAVAMARMTKDDDEIALLRKAAVIASEVADEIPPLLSEGVKEYEVAAEINYMMQKKGASGAAFETIASFGAKSAEPHYTGGTNALKKHEFALFDFGALYRRYRSDITRTFVFGKAKKEHRKMYDVVLRAQEIGFEELAKADEGQTTGGVHRAVEEYINSTKFKGRFIHSTGHTIGLSIHDGGVLHPRFDVPLEEGMVFTNEPGVYIPGFGGVRIEDDVVVRKGSAEILTNAARELREI